MAVRWVNVGKVWGGKSADPTVESSGSLSRQRQALRKAYDASSCRSSSDNHLHCMSVLHIEVMSAGC